MKRKKLICGLIIFLLATTTVSLVLFLNKTKVEIENKVKKNDLALVALKEQMLQEMLSIYYMVRGKDLSRFYVNDTFLNENAYIAHGGGINEFTYTNSKEALIDSIKNEGFRFVEIDLLETIDKKLLAAHDWGSFNKLVNMNQELSQNFTSNQLKQLKIRGKYTPMTGDELRMIMEDNPDFILITDKIRNYELLLKEIPFSERMIVEVFSPTDYLNALRSGVLYPAYCIWSPSHLEVAKKYRFPIVTMDANLFFNHNETIKSVQMLHDSGVTILLFWNDFKDRDSYHWLKQYLGKTVSKIYTDSWSPNKVKHLNK